MVLDDFISEAAFSTASGGEPQSRPAAALGLLPLGAQLEPAAKEPLLGRPLRRLDRRAALGGQGALGSPRQSHERPAHPALPDDRGPQPVRPRQQGGPRVGALRLRRRRRGPLSDRGRQPMPPVPSTWTSWTQDYSTWIYLYIYMSTLSMPFPLIAFIAMNSRLVGFRKRPVLELQQLGFKDVSEVLGLELRPWPAL